MNLQLKQVWPSISIPFFPATIQLEWESDCIIDFLWNWMSRIPLLHEKGSFKQMRALGHTWDPICLKSLRWEQEWIQLREVTGDINFWTGSSGVQTWKWIGRERAERTNPRISVNTISPKCLHCSVSAGIVWAPGWKGAAVCGCKHTFRWPCT